METRGKGRKGPARTLPRETRSSTASGLEGVRTRGRLAETASRINSVSFEIAPATATSVPNSVSPSGASSTTRSEKRSAEGTTRRRRSRRSLPSSISGSDLHPRLSRRGRRGKESAGLEGSRRLRLRLRPNEEGEAQSSRIRGQASLAESPQEESKGSSEPRRRSRKRRYQESGEEGAATSTPNRTTRSSTRHPSKRARRSSAGSGSNLLAYWTDMDATGENGEETPRESEVQNAASERTSGLQGLLRRLGAGLDDLFPMSGSNSGRFRQILSVLRSSSDDGQRLEALTQLCDVLSVGTEDSMVSFSVDSFVPPLVALLNSGTSPELMLLAARALTHMMDALPSSASAIAQNGAAAPLCNNLIAIEFMDLAEQSLAALEKLSVDYPQSIVRAGGLAAALSFIDFFQTGVKRVAVTLASNLCRNPPSDSVEFIVDVLPVMMNLLDSEDQRIRESTIQGFARLADSFRSNSERLETFCGKDFVLVDKIVSLVCSSPSLTLTPASYSAALRLLATLARGSAKLANRELSSEVLITTLKTVLDSGGSPHAVDALQLTDALLPEIPDSSSEDGFCRRRRRQSGSSASAYAAIDAARHEDIKQDPQPLVYYGNMLFSCLIQFCLASPNASVRRVSEITLAKFVELAPATVLRPLLIPTQGPLQETKGRQVPDSNVSFCSFVARLLGKNNAHQEILIGILLSGVAMEKLSDIKTLFVREGVIHELLRLAPETETDDEDGTNKRDVESRKITRLDEPDRCDARSLMARKAMKDADIFIKEKAKKVVDRFCLRGADETDLLPCSILKDLVPVREALLKAANTNNIKAIEDGLTTFLRILGADESVSNFEMAQSNLIDALIEALIAEGKPDVMRGERAVAFVKALAAQRNSSLVFRLLVSRVLGVLASEEDLATCVNEGANSNSSSSVSHGLRQLAQPFKLRLRRAPATEGGADLRHYSHQVVAIEPLATMSSVQDFLWPRVRQLSSAGASEAELAVTSTPESPHDEEVAIDEDPDRGGEMEEEVPEEGFLGIGEEIDAELAHDHEEGEENSDDNASGSGSDNEIIDNEEEEEMGDAGAAFSGSDQLSRSLSAVEVDYDLLEGASARHGIPSSSGSERRRNPSSSRGHRSYAAAVANEFNRSRSIENENTTSGRRSSSVPKLLFSMNGNPVPHNWSILQAVLRSNTSGRIVRPRMWEEVHTLTYSLPSPPSTQKRGAQSEKGGDCNEPNGAEGSSVAQPSRRSRRLQGSEPIDVEASAEEKPDKVSAFGESVKKGRVTGQSGEVTQESKAFVPEFSISDKIPPPTSKTLRLLMYLYWTFQHITGFISLPMSEAPSLSISPDVSFVSQKIAAKMARQLSDPLALCGGAVPEWCHALARDVPFVLPFSVRRTLFNSTALGVARALNHLQARADASSVLGSRSVGGGRISSMSRDGEARISRIQRQKVRIHRSRLLDSAIRVMHMYAADKTVLEVEYFGEVGTGLGPTLEFYTLVSRELQRIKHGLWRTQEVIASVKITENRKVISGKGKGRGKGKARTMFSKSKSAAQAGEKLGVKGKKRALSRRISSSKCPATRMGEAEPQVQYVIPTGVGLFPACLPQCDDRKSAREKILDYFRFIGRLTAKALSDGRLLDLRFCHVFSMLVLAHARVLHDREEGGKNVETAVDEKSLLRYFPLRTCGLDLLEPVDSRLAKSLRSILQMTTNTGTDMVADLCLNFTVPGHDDIELIPGGKDTEVTGENAAFYVSQVVKYVLLTGVRQQAEKFIVGFSEVLDVKSLLCFCVEELEMLMCGPSFEKWDKEYLIRATRCDHGYRHESSAVDYLLRVLAELKQEDQRKFLLFVTGSPALPVGGLAGLHPRLTIVKRSPESGRSADECLPTVMTCTNYLKLPDYSSFEICKERIYYAIREGQGSFHLS